MQLDAAIDFDCDACGCSASGGSLGFSSMLNSNFVGIRYFNQSYSSRDGILLTLLGLMKISIRLKFDQIPVTEKIQIAALIPYHFHNRELTTGTKTSAVWGYYSYGYLFCVSDTKG
jgi:hypothetical protein